MLKTPKTAGTMYILTVLNYKNVLRINTETRLSFKGAVSFISFFATEYTDANAKQRLKYFSFQNCRHNINAKKPVDLFLSLR